MSTDLRCSSCGTEVPNGLSFCTSCGTQLDAMPFADAGEQGQEPAAAVGSAATGADSSDGLKGKVRQVQEDPANREFVDAVKGYAALPGVRAALTAAGIGVLITLVAGLILAIIVPQSSFLSLQGEALEGPSLFEKILVYSTGLTLSGLGTTGGAGGFSWQQLPLVFLLIPLMGVGFGVVREFPKQLTNESQKGLLLWGLLTGAASAVFMAVIVLLGAGWEADGFEYAVPLGKTFIYALLWGCLGGVGGVALLLRRRGVPLDLPLPGRSRDLLPLAVPPIRTFGIALLVFSLIGTGIWTVQSVRDAADARGDRSMAAAVFDSVAYTADLGVRNLGLGSNSTIQIGNASPPYQPGFSSGTSPAVGPVPIYRGGLTEGATDGPRDRLRELIADAEVNDINQSEVKIFDYSEVLGVAFLPFLIVFIGLTALLAVYSGFLVARVGPPRPQGETILRGALVGPVWSILIVLVNAFSETVAFGQLSSESAFISLLIGGALLGALGGFLASSQKSEASH